MDVGAFDGPPPTILVVEDDAIIGRMLTETLEAEGFSVVVMPSGESGLEYAMREVPHLLILDIMLPGIDGFEVVKQLRNHAKTAHIPVVIVSGRHDTADKVRAFDFAVDDYLTKPFNSFELIARIRTQLRHVRESLLAPLTGLPSGMRIERAIEQQLNMGGPWSILYLDLDNFKAYNDVYGFVRGNDMIRLLGRVITDATHDLGNVSDFVGHIGGDDFVVITTPDRAELLCQRIMTQWDAASRIAYDAATLERGTLIAMDRQGHPQNYPLVALSIAVVTSMNPAITTIADVSSTAAELKRKAKSVVGSSYYIDHRAGEARPVQ